jgi:hypothetical protein
MKSVEKQTYDLEDGRVDTNFRHQHQNGRKKEEVIVYSCNKALSSTFNLF